MIAEQETRKLAETVITFPYNRTDAWLTKLPLTGGKEVPAAFLTDDQMFEALALSGTETLCQSFVEAMPGFKKMMRYKAASEGLAKTREGRCLLKKMYRCYERMKEQAEVLDSLRWATIQGKKDKTPLKTINDVEEFISEKILPNSRFIRPYLMNYAEKMEKSESAKPADKRMAAWAVGGIEENIQQAVTLLMTIGWPKHVPLPLHLGLLRNGEIQPILLVSRTHLEKSLKAS